MNRYSHVSVSFLLYHRPPTAEQDVNQRYRCSSNQQQVNHSTSDLSDQAQDPQTKKNNENGPKHNSPSSDFLSTPQSVFVIELCPIQMKEALRIEQDAGVVFLKDLVFCCNTHFVFKTRASTLDNFDAQPMSLVAFARSARIFSAA